MGEFREGKTEPKESFEDFKKRVKKETGKEYDDIPVSENEQDALLMIIARHGNTYVVGYGPKYEDHEKDTIEFDEYRVVHIAQK